MRFFAPRILSLCVRYTGVLFFLFDGASLALSEALSGTLGQIECLITVVLLSSSFISAVCRGG